jgi:D-alanyl-D-alanine carboxypeptidase (penicillin-binding protein 5/6)
VVTPPPFDQRNAAPGDPFVSAQRAVVIDADSGRVLWARNPDSPAYPASTTKICTALVLAEACKPDETVKAPEGIEMVGEASLHLSSGEMMTAQDLLTGILLRSANDGCVAAAVHVAGSVPAFAEKMNQKAREVGCTHTNFVNPNGLHDPKHVTTAHDLAMLGRAALDVPRIAEIVRRRDGQIARSVVKGDVKLKSKNALLDLDPSCRGIKTGWTVPAGHCFVGAFERNGMRLVTATLASGDWKNDHLALATYAADHYEPVKWADVNANLTIPVQGGLKASVAAHPAKEGKTVVSKGSGVPAVKTVFDPVKAPVKVGQKVGKLFLDGPENMSIDLVASEPIDVAKSSPLSSPSSSPTLWWVGAGVSGILVARWMGGKRRRRAR